MSPRQYQTRLNEKEVDMLLEHCGRDLLSNFGDPYKTLAICRRRLETAKALLERMPVTLANGKRTGALDGLEHRVRASEQLVRQALGTRFTVLNGGRR